MPWIVYETLNKSNGKTYIGVHKQDGDGFDGYLGSGQAISRAIAKYGRDNFERRTLFSFQTDGEAYAKEAELVGQQWVESTWNYNLKGGGIGGAGFSMPEEAREKLRQYRTGRLHSEETKQKISERRKGLLHTPESREKMSRSRTGVPHSEERKRNISVGMKKSWQLRRNPNAS